MWSAGCILYILLCGYPPFYGDDDQEILRAVIKGEYEFQGEEWLVVSSQAKNLIRQLICKPEVRLTAEEALNHEWLRDAANVSDALQAKKLNKINIESLKKFQHH